jgi:DUF2075 family protein
MIVYSANKQSFRQDVDTNNIDQIIHIRYTERTGRRVGQKELDSWRNSLMYVDNILEDPGIPNETGVFVEYHIQQSTKRVDLLLSGIGPTDRRNLILIELKQWTDAQVTDMDGIVRTRLGGGLHETNHPSYQAWSYAGLLRNFNEVVYDGGVDVYPCVYAHNFNSPGILDDSRYKFYVEKAPLFLRSDAKALRSFIKEFIHTGDNGQLLFDIENGRIRPSIMLGEKIGSMLKGNQEFVMIDDQKVVFEKALSLVKTAKDIQKQVYIVQGGPGTGKSVVAINLLARATEKRYLSTYVTKNRAPRMVYEQQLSGAYKKTEINNLFKGSGSFQNVPDNLYDLIIVDEAHRLNEKSGLYGNQGVNQVMELIKSSRTSVFFLDEDQKVTLSDIGSKDEVELWARNLGAQIHYGTLASQFRCSGSDSYLPWLDNTLQIRETANDKLSAEEFQFRIFDSASELRDHIYELNKEKNKARMVAGYCWDWVSKGDSQLADIVFPGTDFSAQWNLNSDGGLWITAKHSVEQVGCIHTCQGLEVDHVGVIIGPDFVVRDGVVITNGLGRSSMDSSIKGYRTLHKTNPQEAIRRADPIIKNTYRTLLTRGMKSCSIYCTDEETAAYFRSQFIAE